MKNKIIFTKSNKLGYAAILLCVLFTFLLAYITNNFTALPDFEGDAKAVIGDLFFPVGYCLMIYFTIAFFRFPKKIMIENSKLIIEGIDIPENWHVTIFKAWNDMYQIGAWSENKKIILTGPSYSANIEYTQLKDMQSDRFNISVHKIK